MKKMARLGLVLVGVLFGGLFTVRAYAVEGSATEMVDADASDVAKYKNITKNCVEIHDKLVSLQHDDSRARVYLGRHYELILTDFVKPLNVWLVENSLSAGDFVENQNNLVAVRADFVSDYVNYQKRLEDLVAMDCASEPEKFYDTLKEVRAKRKIVEQDVKEMRTLISGHMKLVVGLEKKL